MVLCQQKPPDPPKKWGLFGRQAELYCKNDGFVLQRSVFFNKADTGPFHCSQSP